MAASLCSWLTSLTGPAASDALGALRSLPWPEAVQRPARFLFDTLGVSLDDPETAPVPSPEPAAPSTVAVLLEVVENRGGRFGSATRVAAVRALGELLASDEDAALVAATRDLDADVSLAAVSALADRGGAAAAVALAAVCEDESGFFLDSTRAAARAGLARVPPTPT